MQNPIRNQYDFGLGIEPDIIDYIKESHIIQSRVSPTRCYLLQRRKEGDTVTNQDMTGGVDNWLENDGFYYFILWDSYDKPKPDLRPFIDKDLEGISIWVDGNKFKRVLDIADLQNDNEFTVVENKLKTPPEITVVFNKNFNPANRHVFYSYTSVRPGVDDISVKYDYTDMSLYGWIQYLDADTALEDPLRGPHQILVRTPLTREGFTLNEEGQLTLLENQCWMIWEPYVYANDILIVPPEESPSGEELRFNITDKQDSRIQGHLVSQRFRIVLLEKNDSRYKIPYIVE